MNTGFILTCLGLDTSKGYQLSFLGKAKDGPFELRFSDQGPVFFLERSIPCDWGGHFERKEVPLKNFSGQMVDALYFNSQKEAKTCADFLKEKGIRTFEADVRTPERFLMERFIKGIVEFQSERVEFEKGVRVYFNPSIRPGHTMPALSTLSLDIETSRGNDLFSIGIHYKYLDIEIKKVFMVGENQGDLEEGSLIYCPDEKKCYQQFESYFHELDPDLVLGWHVVGFDLKFLEKKCSSWGIGLNLGRKKKVAYLRENNHRGWNIDLYGRCVIDGPPSLRAAFFQYENFKLDTVAHEVLGKNKDISSTGMEKVEEIERRFKEDKVALAFYNLEDCVLVTEIYRETKLIELLISRVMITGLLIDRLAFSTLAFDYFYLPRVHRKGYVAPNILDIERTDHTAGGLVLEPEAGLHHDIFVLDFKSLYPSIIRTFKIDPLSRLKAKDDYYRTPTGHFFSRTEHILPEYLGELMEKRKDAREKGDDSLSQAIKILMNSFYGVMGTTRCRFYHADLPSAITGTGQWLLRETTDYLEKEGLRVVYGDTDSVFVKVDFKNGDWMAEGRNLAIKVNGHINKLIEKSFNCDSYLEIEFEKYFSKFFLPRLRGSDTGAKKKYVGLLKAADETTTIHFSGMEYVRSDWTKLARNFQYKLFQKYLALEDVEDFICGTINDLNSGIYDHDLVYRKRLSKDLAEYTKSRPPHVQAALKLKDKGLPVARNIEYIISMDGPVPVELGSRHIDYEHYREKQIRPVADIVLEELGTSFDELFGGGQLDFFV